MEYRFTKMHGLGNDFVLFDGVRASFALNPGLVRRIADRRLGIGCDQVLLIEKTQAPGADFRYRIFNADGGEVQQCGNGSRCVARYLRDEGLIEQNQVTVETAGGLIQMFLRDDAQVVVNMGVPIFAPDRIPFAAAAQAVTYELDVDGQSVAISALSMGNPHAVMRVDDVAAAPVATWGPLISLHPRFPERVNAGFMQIVDTGHIRLRVYERGAGETPACGTGACAAVVAGRTRGFLDAEAVVDLPGGQLLIRWEGDGQPVWMTGPAVRVYEGTLSL